MPAAEDARRRRAIWMLLMHGDSGTVTTTAVTTSPNPSTSGGLITITATITASPGPPTGTVSFFEGLTKIGTGTISGTTATMTTSTLSVGGHVLTAQYNGDNTYAGSTSPNYLHTVT